MLGGLGGLSDQLSQLRDVVKDKTSDGLQADEVSSLGKLAETQSKKETEKTKEKTGKKDVLTEFAKGMDEKYNKGLEKLREDNPQLQQKLEQTEEQLEAMPEKGQEQVVHKSGDDIDESVKQQLEMEESQKPIRQLTRLGSESPKEDTVIDEAHEMNQALKGKETEISKTQKKEEPTTKKEDLLKAPEDNVESPKEDTVIDEAHEIEQVSKGKEKELDKTKKKEGPETPEVQVPKVEQVQEKTPESEEQTALNTAISDFKKTGDSSKLDTICLQLAKKGNTDAMEMLAYTALDKAITKKDPGDLLKIFNGILPQGISIPQEKLTEMRDKIIAMAMEKAIKDPEAIETLAKLKPQAAKEVMMFHRAMEGDVTAMQDLKRGFPEVGEKAVKYLEEHGNSGLSVKTLKETVVVQRVDMENTLEKLDAGLKDVNKKIDDLSWRDPKLKELKAQRDELKAQKKELTKEIANISKIEKNYGTLISKQNELLTKNKELETLKDISGITDPKQLEKREKAINKSENSIKGLEKDIGKLEVNLLHRKEKAGEAELRSIYQNTSKGMARSLDYLSIALFGKRYEVETDKHSIPGKITTTDKLMWAQFIVLNEFQKSGVTTLSEFNTKESLEKVKTQLAKFGFNEKNCGDVVKGILEKGLDSSTIESIQKFAKNNIPDTLEHKKLTILAEHNEPKLQPQLEKQSDTLRINAQKTILSAREVVFKTSFLGGGSDLKTINERITDLQKVRSGIEQFQNSLKGMGEKSFLEHFGKNSVEKSVLSTELQQIDKELGKLEDIRKLEIARNKEGNFVVNNNTLLQFSKVQGVTKEDVSALSAFKGRRIGGELFSRVGGNEKVSSFIKLAMSAQIEITRSGQTLEGIRKDVSELEGKFNSGFVKELGSRIKTTLDTHFMGETDTALQRLSVSLLHEKYSPKGLTGEQITKLKGVITEEGQKLEGTFKAKLPTFMGYGETDTKRLAVDFLILDAFQKSGMSPAEFNKKENLEKVINDLGIGNTEKGQEILNGGVFSSGGLTLKRIGEMSEHAEKNMPKEPQYKTMVAEVENSKFDKTGSRKHLTDQFFSSLGIQGNSVYIDFEKQKKVSIKVPIPVGMVTTVGITASYEYRHKDYCSVTKNEQGKYEVVLNSGSKHKGEIGAYCNLIEGAFFAVGVDSRFSVGGGTAKGIRLTFDNEEDAKKLFEGMMSGHIPQDVVSTAKFETLKISDFSIGGGVGAYAKIRGEVTALSDSSERLETRSMGEKDPKLDKAPLIDSITGLISAGIRIGIDAGRDWHTEAFTGTDGSSSIVRSSTTTITGSLDTSIVTDIEKLSAKKDFYSLTTTFNEHYDKAGNLTGSKMNMTFDLKALGASRRLLEMIPEGKKKEVEALIEQSKKQGANQISLSFDLKETKGDLSDPNNYQLTGIKCTKNSMDISKREKSLWGKVTLGIYSSSESVHSGTSQQVQSKSLN